MGQQKLLEAVNMPPRVQHPAQQDSLQKPGVSRCLQSSLIAWSTLPPPLSTTVTKVNMQTRCQESCCFPVFKCASRRIHQNSILVKNPNTTEQQISFKILCKYIWQVVCRQNDLNIQTPRVALWMFFSSFY